MAQHEDEISKRASRPSGWLAGAGVIEALLDRFGWPGALLIYVIFFIQYYGTLEQKRAMIDLYVLGRGIALFYPIFVLGVVFLFAFFAQRYFYIKKINSMAAELKRLGEWKTQHQEHHIGVPLHHSEAKEE